MDMCRVCLTTEKELLALDETFVLQYNLLTSLNITLLDGMPQFSCKTCLETVKRFIKFRETSIASEETLRDLYANVKLEDKNFILEQEAQNTIILKDSLKKEVKSEIKEEIDIDNDTVLDDCDVTYEEYRGDIQNLVRNKDIKVNKRKNKLKKPKTASKVLKTNEDNSNWICGICPKEFVEESDLNKHLDVHKNDRQCKLCKEQVNSLSQLLGHRLTHVPQKQFKCHICSKLHRTCLYLEFHYRTVHIDDDDPTLTCKICSSSYRSPRKLHGHMTNVHSATKYICDLCSKGFTSKPNLTSHIKHHSAIKPYVCDLCGFSCNYSNGLKSHKIRKHYKNKIYCNNCGRIFSNREECDKHTCKIPLHVCSICGLQLSGSSKLSRHMISHSNVFKYECDRCPAKYKSNGALKVHLNKHDGIRTKQCEYCPAKFYSTTVLQKHRRIHTGEKPYVCKVCHKGFTGNHNLKVHMRVHGEYLIVKKNNDDIPK